MNNRRLLIAAVFHFVHPVEKDIKKHHKLTQNSVSFSCQSKQVSRCCISFPHELTCQVLTNQSMKIGRRTWPARDHANKRSFPPVLAEFSRPWLVWNQNLDSARPLWHKHNTFHLYLDFWKPGYQKHQLILLLGNLKQQNEFKGPLKAFRWRRAVR